MLPARSLLFLAIPFLCQAKDRQPDLTYFEENRGQAPAAVRYLARAGTFQMFLEESDTVVAVRGQPFRFHLAGQSSEKGGNGNLNPEGTLPLLSDYVIGNDPAKWRHRIANFRTVRRKGVYPGIDQLFYSNPQRLEYDFVVHPGGDPGQIRIQLIGSGRMRIDSRGQLVAQAGSSRLVQHPPAAYQIDAAGQRQQVAAAWRMKAGGVRIASLEIGAYDRRRELVIDPEFEAASAVGGTGRDQWTGLVKSGSDFYMVGSTETLEYPGAGGSHGRNITVVRLNSSLEALRVAYVGGGGKDTALAISTGQRGIRVVGETDSRDFPTGSFTSDNRPVKPQTHYGGGASDGFFFEFSFPAIYESRTTPLIYSSYVGGSAEDRVTACTAYMIAGETRSTDLPPSITGSNHGGWDAFGIYLGFDYSWQGAYIGGSGDERVKSIGAIGSYLAVAGSTTSPDLPVSNAWQNRLNGPKDGFVATVPLSVVSLPPSPLVSYWGGSGEDEIVAIQQAGGRITILGTTSSTDLPLMNPVQGAYGGGKSDVFLSQFDLPSGALQFSTYFGGPGDDIATHMAFLAPGVFEAVGTTTSERLPVKGTGQSGYGGGASDAFAVRYATGTGGVVTALQSAQYLGGSGAESVFGLADETIGINSDSPEGSWRGPKPLGAKGGGGDGFLFTLSEPVITATSEVYLTTNQTTGIGLHFGGAVPISDGIKLTLSSSDPGKVRIFDIAAGDAVATFTTIVTTRNRTLRLLGLDRAGEVTITASAEGYSPVTIRVHLVQTQWNWTMNGLILPPATLKLPVNGSAYAQLVDGYLIPGTTSLIYPGTRPSSPSETFTFESSDANVVTATSFGRNTVSLTRLTAGTVQIMASSPGLGGAVPPPPLVVETADPAPVLGYSPPATVTAALGTIYSFNVQVNGGGRVRVRIQDPSMAQLLDPLTDQPMDEVTVFARSNVRIVARSSSGSSQLIFTVDGQMAWTTAVQFTLPVIGLLPKPLALFPGESVLASLKYENFFGFDSLIEGDSVTVELISSNPSVVAVTNPRFDWARGMGVAGAPRVTGIGKGSADLTLTLVRGPDLLQFTKTHVEVPEGTLGIASAVVGKNLETALQITSSLNNTALLVESSDPSRLLVNGGPTAVVTTGAAGAAAVRVAGLADSGEVTVRVSGTGLAAANTVQLSRSGLVLTLSLPGYLPFPLFAGVTALAQPPSVSFAINTTGGLGVQPAAIGETGIPLAVQDLRPGFDAVPFRATVSDPRLLANLQISPVQKGSGGSVQFDALTTAGTARLQIEQPEGFVKPSIGAEVDLQIVRRYASVSPVTLVKDSALAIPLAYSFDRATTLTIASSDPSKVLLSVDGKSAGSASISIDTKATPQIYLYALADSGAAVITYSSPDYEVVRQDVALQPVTWMLNGFSGSSTFNPLYTSIDSQPVALTLAATASYAVVFRPGFTLRVPLTVANRSVALPSADAFVFQGATNASTVTLRALSVGKTALQIDLPASSVVSPSLSNLSLEVRGPFLFFGSSRVALGRDLALAVEASFANVEAQGSVRVTLESADPSRVLLSLDPAQPGDARVAVTARAGSAVPLYVQGMASDGEVRITATADGYASGQLVVSLRPTALRLNLESNQDFTTIFGTREINTTLTASPDYRPGETPSGSFTIRPGADWNIRLVSSDPTVIEVPQGPLPLKSFIVLRSLRTGTAEISIEASPGPVLPAPYPVVVKVPGLPFSLGSLTTARQLQTYFSYAGFGVPVTVTTSDGSVLRVSASATAPGSGTITLPGAANQSVRVFFQGIAEGSAVLTLSAPGYANTLARVTVTAPAISWSTVTSTLYTLGGPSAYSVRVGPSVAFGSVYWPNPGTDVRIDFSSSDSTVVRAPSSLTLPGSQPDSEYLSAGGGPSSVRTLSLSPLRDGTASLKIITPAGWQNGPDLAVEVRKSLAILSQVRVAGKDSVRVVTANLQGFDAVSAQNARIRITSEDPSKLLVSSALNSPIAISVLINGSFGQFYLHSVSDSGTANFIAVAETLQGGTLPLTDISSNSVQLVPSVWAIGYGSVVNANTGQETGLSLALTETNGSGGFNATTLRPSKTVTIPFEVSDDSIVGVRPNPLVVTGGVNYAPTIVLTPKKPGEATISVKDVAGFESNPSLQTVKVTVR